MPHPLKKTKKQKNMDNQINEFDESKTYDWENNSSDINYVQIKKNNHVKYYSGM